MISRSGRTGRGRRLCRAGVRVERDETPLNRERNHMGCLLCGRGLLDNGDGDLSGVQTERRGGAGPAGGLLGGKDPAGRFC
jgi:hypothetical protein